MNSAPPSELGRAGQLVAGKFRLDAMIGRGGMGSVWSATHVGLGHRLALKLIAREFVRSSEALRRFDAEAKAAARLQSRHVVQVFDNGTLDDGTPFIAMELLAGENVSDRITRAGPLGLAQAVEVVAQCCKALGRAHAAGIVHRDIKPDNIFLAREPDEEADVVKILDFGVAKMAIGLESGSHVTGTGTLLGTPLFMSPEQIRGSREVDHRTDLYSLGLVVYTMLTGGIAIAGETFGDLLINICTEPLPSLIATVPSLPYAMEAWFQRACAREPANRYQSAQEFSDTLRAAAGTAARLSSSPGYPPTMLAAQSPGVANTAPPGSVLAASQVTAGQVTAPLPGFAPAFAQSAAAVSVTAAGVPRRPIGAWVAGSVLAALFALGGGILFTLAPRHDDPAGAVTPGASVSSVLAVAPADAGAASKTLTLEPVPAVPSLQPARSPAFVQPVVSARPPIPPAVDHPAAPAVSVRAPVDHPTTPTPLARPAPLSTVNVGY